MNDIRRTILWVIFGFSMVLLWDQWQIHNGNKPTFFPQAPVKTESGAPANQAGASTVPSVSPAANATGAAAVPAIGGASTANAPRQRFEVKTDVLHLVIDSEGASIVQADLLPFKDHGQQDRAMRLLDESKDRVYLAQSGLITAEAGAQVPTHKTPMRLVSNAWPRTLLILCEPVWFRSSRFRKIRTSPATLAPVCSANRLASVMIDGRPV